MAGLPSRPVLYCDSPDSSALGAKHQAQSRAKHWLISLEHAGLGTLEERHSDTGDSDRAFLPKHVLKGRAAPRRWGRLSACSDAGCVFLQDPMKQQKFFYFTICQRNKSAMTWGRLLEKDPPSPIPTEPYSHTQPSHQVPTEF